jgi:alditol oxidase
VSVELTNWVGNFTYGAETVHYPTSVADVQELVARLPRAKALGTQHSFNDIADCTGALVSLSKMAPAITVDVKAMTVSVTGGTPYGVLAAELHSQGYALHNTGSLPHISVAGATATGTHGSGDCNGILSTAVSAVELVKSDGSLVTVDRVNPDLKALAVGMGAFGIITRLVLDIQPTYMVRQDVYRDAPWDTVLDGLDEVMASAYSVSLLGDLGSPVIRELWQKPVWSRSLTDTSSPSRCRRPCTAALGTTTPRNLPSTASTSRAGVAGPWSERLPHFRLDAPPSVGGDEPQSDLAKTYDPAGKFSNA